MSTAEITGSFTRLPIELEALLVCPRCKCRLEVQRSECLCTHPGCGTSYPIRRGVPVLFNETTSLFSIAGVLAGEDKPFPLAAQRRSPVHLRPAALAQRKHGIGA